MLPTVVTQPTATTPFDQAYANFQAAKAAHEQAHSNVIAASAALRDALTGFEATLSASPA